MLRDAAVAVIQEQLGFRSDLTTNIITNLQTAQVQLEVGPTIPWFLVSSETTFLTTIGSQAVPIPFDFLDEHDEVAIRYVPSVLSDATPEVDLRKDGYKTLRQNYADEETGTTMAGPPEAYALLGINYMIFPVPDAIYTLKQFYYKQDAILSSNIENQWLKYMPYLLIGMAGMQLAGALRDTMAYQQFSSWEKANRLLLASQDTQREVDNEEMQMGGPH